MELSAPGARLRSISLKSIVKENSLSPINKRMSLKAKSNLPEKLSMVNSQKSANFHLERLSSESSLRAANDM